ncbi:ABC transporter ATP-binding protein [Candidatus Saganbacteria bacterium]|nr:ABC transporter ATP-binding protein [Candidatus Saganbacteria bacterium]
MKILIDYLNYFKSGISSKILPANLVGNIGTFSLKNILPLFARYRRQLIIGFLAVLLLTPLGYFMPLITRYLIDDVILGRKMNLLIAVLPLIVLVKLLEKLTSIWQNFYFTKLGRDVLLDLQTDLIARVMHFPKSFFDNQSTGYLLSRITNDVQGVQWFFTGTLAYFITNILKLVFGLCFLFFLEWRLALVNFLLLPLFFLIVKYFSGKVRNLSHNQMEQQARVNKKLQEAIAETTLIKSFAAEKKEIDKISSSLKDNYRLSLQATTVNSITSTMLGSLTDLSYLIVLLIGLPLVITKNWSLGSLYAFLAYQSYVFSPIQYLSSFNLQLQNALAAFQRVSAFYEILPEGEDQETRGKGQEKEKIVKLEGKIELKNISFSYDGLKYIFKEQSFSIKAREHVLLVGSSGAGKSTFLNLLLGFYRLQEGEIFYDGRPISRINLKSLRARLGFVGQNPRLLSGTILENLRYGNETAAVQDIVAACRTANIHDFITGLPHGYEATIEEQGNNFSCGQIQRLAIARALLKEPDILILDEPSAALDSASEEKILSELVRRLRDKTIIIVSHKPLALEKVDRVIKIG